MKKDIDYIVKDGEVLIVDEFTGRIMYEEDTIMDYIKQLKQKKELRLLMSQKH